MQTHTHTHTHTHTLTDYSSLALRPRAAMLITLVMKCTKVLNLAVVRGVDLYCRMHVHVQITFHKVWSNVICHKLYVAAFYWILKSSLKAVLFSKFLQTFKAFCSFDAPFSSILKKYISFSTVHYSLVVTSAMFAVKAVQRHLHGNRHTHTHWQTTVPSICTHVQPS